MEDKMKPPKGMSPEIQKRVEALKRAKTSFFFRKMSEDSALEKLLGVMVKKRSSDEEAETVDPTKISVDEALLKTCQIIGVKERIEFQESFKHTNDSWTPLKKILRSSNIRSRKVKLEGKWWTQDGGPFLGYLKENNFPVALMPAGRTYEIHRIDQSEKVKVDEAVATTLKNEGEAFFSPLPNRALTAKDIVKFALQFTKADLIRFLIIGILGAILSLLIPIAAGYIFNKILPANDVGILMQIGGLMIATVLVLGILNFTKSMLILRFEGKSNYKLQSALWDRILSLKVPFFKQFNPGDLAERSMGVEKIRTILSANVMDAVISAIFSIFYLSLMFYYDVGLALLALVLGSIVALFTLTISRLAYKYVAGFKRMEAIISGFMMMILSGINKIRITNTGEKVYDIWADKFSQQKKHYAGKQRLLIIAAIFTYAFPIIASIAIYMRIHHLMVATDSGFRIGDFIAFNTAYLSFQGALIAAFMVTVPVMSIKPTFQLFKPILEADLEDYEDKVDPGVLKGNIDISNLSFRYKDSEEQILKRINMKIEAGQFVALVGGSGSGKSTLMRILLGFEDYNTGSVLYDNNELSELDIRAVRDQLGVVLQGGKIMQGTVLFNIISTANYTEEDAWEAARMAGCEKDIQNLEKGMHTILPAGGDNLSGGQRQRIIIARALVKRPKLLMLDEATSALDNDTQKTVSENVDKLKATRIVIAHRLSTIKEADKIFVLDHGEIKESGSYKELIDKKGAFFDLVQSQMTHT